MTPLISVLVAGYQVEDDIGPCIESVLAQSLGDFELVVVDDASTDGTVEMVRRYVAQDQRIRLLVLPHNGGAAAARNAGLALCRGRWVALLDADDGFAPERLAALLARTQATNADMVADNLQIVSHPDRQPRGVAFGAGEWPQSGVMSLADYLRSNDFRAARYSFGYLKPMVRRALVEAHHLRFREDLALCEDYHFHLDCLLAGASWQLIPDALYRYAARPHSLSRAVGPERLDNVLAHSRRQLDAMGQGEPLRRLILHRHRRLARLQAYLSFRQHLRGRAWVSALRQLLLRPGLLGPGLATLCRRGLAHLPRSRQGVAQR